LQYPIFRDYSSKDAFINKGKEFLYTKEDDFKKLQLDKSIISWIICDKIIKMEVLKHLYFPEDMIYEDNYFMLNLIKKLNSVYISEKGMYYYYKRENSTTTSKLTLKSELSTLKVLMHKKNMVKSSNEKGVLLKYLIQLINLDKSLKHNFNPEMRMSEDLVFVLEYTFFCDIISVINEPLYFYNRLNESGISQPTDSKYIKDLILTSEAIETTLLAKVIRNLLPLSLGL